jgi:hypothetical protein
VLLSCPGEREEENSECCWQVARLSSARVALMEASESGRYGRDGRVFFFCICGLWLSEGRRLGGR